MVGAVAATAEAGAMQSVAPRAVESGFPVAPTDGEDQAEPHNGQPCDAAAKAKSHVFQDRWVDRITLRRAGVTLASLFHKTLIQEPTFKELVILYRAAAADGPNQAPAAKDRTIHIKAFRDIPMADLEVIFPEKKISMQPLDLTKLVITAVIGLGMVAAKVLTSVLNPVLALAALASIGGYAAKVFMGFKVSRDRYEHLVTNSLYHKNQDNDLGVIFYLLDSLEDQEFKEAALAYFMLWREGAMTESQLDARCERFLQSKFDVEVDFEVDDAVGKLLREGLLTEADGQYSVCPLDEALRRMDEKWDNFFQYHNA